MPQHVAKWWRLHEKGQRLVAGSGWAIEKAVGLHQRQAWVSDFHAPFKDFHHGSGAGKEEILVDDGVGHRLADGRLREHGYLFAQGLADDLVAGQQVGDETDQPFKSGGAALIRVR